MQGQFAARQVSGGDELKLQISWADIATYAQGPTIVPGAGSSIGLDFAYDVGDGGGARLFQSSFVLEPQESEDSGCPQFDFPSCNDRTWCTPTLAP